MRIDMPSLAAILGMGLVTYATRAGGLWVAGRLPSTPRLEAALRYMPGAVLTAIVTPMVVGAGLAGLGATLATVLVARRTGNLLLAVGTGVTLVWIFRHIL